jgi:hypothetical protein
MLRGTCCVAVWLCVAVVVMCGQRLAITLMRALWAAVLSGLFGEHIDGLLRVPLCC